MKKKIFLLIILLFAVTILTAQTAMQFSQSDCNGNFADLFADLDSGKAVLLHFFMPNCGVCSPPAQEIQTMADNINANHPGFVKGYASPDNDTTGCAYTISWVTSNGLSLYRPIELGGHHVSNYGGSGMPTIVLVGGLDHRVLFSTLTYGVSDTIEIRDSILALYDRLNSINNLPSVVSSFNLFPNPASDHVDINLSLKESSDILIDVTDITGKQIAVVNNEKQNGVVKKRFSTFELPNGNYLVRLFVNGKAVTQKLTIVH